MDHGELVFSCSSDAAKAFSVALSAIAWRAPASQSCCVSVREEGILFLTEDVSCLQASVLLKRQFFKSYSIIDLVRYEFRVNLTSLVHCLNVFGDTATSVDMSVLNDAELRLKIYDQGSTTECVIRTMHYPPEQRGDMTLADVFTAERGDMCAFMVSSYVCRELFRFPNERKNKAAEIVLTINVENRSFEVKAEGAYGVVRSVVPQNQADFQRVEIHTRENFSARYPGWALTPVLSAMANSFETRFRFKRNGLLSVQQGIKATGSRSGVETVVEFIIQALEEVSVF